MKLKKLLLQKPYANYLLKPQLFLQKHERIFIALIILTEISKIKLQLVT